MTTASLRGTCRGTRARP